MVIQDLHDPNLVVSTRSVDLQSHLYQFDDFESFNFIGFSLISHVDIVRKLWHEYFDNANYRYL